VLKAKNTRNC